MSNTIVDEIYAFNKQAGFLDKGMDPFMESAYVFEEAMEGYEDVLNMPEDPNAPTITARDWALGLLNQIKDAKEQRNLPMPSEVAELDKAIDGVWFNIGKILKMGLTTDQTQEAFSIVAERNMAKLGGPKDDLGKQLKPEGWYGPEEALEALLQRRKNPQPTLKEADEE